MEIETVPWGFTELCTCTGLDNSPHQCSRCGAGICEGCGKNDLSTCFEWICKGSCKNLRHLKGNSVIYSSSSTIQPLQILDDTLSEDEHILSPNSADCGVNRDEFKGAAARRSLNTQLKTKYLASDIRGDFNDTRKERRNNVKTFSCQKENQYQACRKKRRVMRLDNAAGNSKLNKKTANPLYKVTAKVSTVSKLLLPDNGLKPQLEKENTVQCRMPSHPPQFRKQRQQTQWRPGQPLRIPISKNAVFEQSYKMAANDETQIHMKELSWLRHDLQRKQQLHSQQKQLDPQHKHQNSYHESKTPTNKR
mmetsp:Transcript_6364/g.8861  ORF Transcript_6364/g.8861 Transcript_6364/m.8861 type:complete len:307 (-) Transcript_6364:116-1036(-)